MKNKRVSLCESVYELVHKERLLERVKAAREKKQPRW